MSADPENTRAVSWTYDGYGAHSCERRARSGLPCRRLTRTRYEWPDRSEYLCGHHGRGLEPAPELAVPRG